MATAASPRFLAAGSSDQGTVRPNNEDRVYCDDVRGIFIVADGMGGHEAGERAAEIAVERMRARLERQTGSVEQRLREAIALANNAIYEAAQAHSEWAGMGCVLTAAVIEEGQITAGHVGDSRLYRIKRGRMEKLTHDHSPVGEREDSGELSEREAMQHPRRNEVYRDLGSQERSPDADDFIEIVQASFERDSAVLLCSDGLSDAVPSDEILKLVERNAGDRRGAVRALIAAANEVGKDNVSAILIEGEAFAASFGRRSSVGETTDRMRGVEREAWTPWYRSGAAYVFYGGVLGAALGILTYVYILQEAASTSRSLVVTAGGTIEAALDRARPGDRVVVARGTYKEAVQLREGVTLSAQRAGEAVIEGRVTADGIQHGRVEGFQIRGKSSGIRIRDSEVVLARDDVAGADGIGVEFSGNSTGAIFGCLIHGNAGGGISIVDEAAPEIENNAIEGNGRRAEALRPGLLIESTQQPWVARNVFAGNGAEAVWLRAGDEALIGRNYFFEAGKAQEQKFRVLNPGAGEKRP